MTQFDVLPIIHKKLQQVDLFMDLEEREVAQLVKHAKFQSLSANEYLFAEGDQGDFFAVVIDGTLSVHKEIEGAPNQQLAIMTENASLGEMSLIDHETRSASVQALEPANIFILTKESFDTLVFEFPTCGTKLLRRISILLSQRVRALSNQVAEI